MSQKTTITILFAGALISAPVFSVSAHSQEHPSEHPQATEKKAAEHPKEHPSGTKAAAQGCSLEDVAGAAEQCVANEAAKKGSYRVWDKKQKKHLKLSLVKVHRERLSKVGRDTFFVCADFQDKAGTVYDIDLFMKGKDKANLKPKGRPSVHKVNGEPRYDWVEKGGVWKQVARAAGN